MLKYNELNFATVANRNSMERPDGLDTGSIIITGLNTKTIIDSIALVLYEKENNIVRDVGR
ncbi:MAG TPA: hypothetical protein PKY46_07805 [Ignavibacteriaceae bacterium]|nr:hypothetical protein [Ignavibacteriaceae bacterium]